MNNLYDTLRSQFISSDTLCIYMRNEEVHTSQDSFHTCSHTLNRIRSMIFWLLFYCTHVYSPRIFEKCLNFACHTTQYINSSISSPLVTGRRQSFFTIFCWTCSRLGNFILLIVQIRMYAQTKKHYAEMLGAKRKQSEPGSHHKWCE